MPPGPAEWVVPFIRHPPAPAAVGPPRCPPALTSQGRRSFRRPRMRTSRATIIAYVLITLAVVLPVLFNFLSPAHLDSLPGWVSKARITLGLDLRGGSHLVLEVDSKAFIEERLQILADDMRQRLVDAKVTRVRPQV